MPMLLLMIIAMVIWGIGWPALKIVTESVDVVVVTFWRFAIMMAAFIPILILWKKPLHVSKKALGIVASSALLNIAFMFVSFWGVKVGSAGAGGVVITTISPVLTVLLAIWFLGAKVQRRHWWGLGIGFLGGMVMLELWRADIMVQGNLLFVLSALIWAVLTLFSQKSHAHLEPVHYSFLLSVVATVIMLFVALPYHLATVFDQDARFWWAMLFLAVMGQSVASTIYFIASGKLGSGVASSYMFLVPLSALVASYLILGEIPSLWLLAGGIIATVALYIINSGRNAA